MTGFTIADATVDQVQAYAAGYHDALTDATDRCRRNTEAIAELEQQLAEALADAAYWERIANPVRVVAGPTYAQLEHERHQLMTAAATSPVADWDGTPVRQPATKGPRG